MKRKGRDRFNYGFKHHDYIVKFKDKPHQVIHEQDNLLYIVKIDRKGNVGGPILKIKKDLFS